MLDMVKNSWFVTRDYGYSTVIVYADLAQNLKVKTTMGVETFLFVACADAATDKLRTNSRLWYESLCGNFHLSMMDSLHLISIEGSPIHIDWVTTWEALGGYQSAPERDVELVQTSCFWPPLHYLE